MKTNKSVFLPNDEATREVLEFLQEKLGLPKLLKGATIILSSDAPITVECVYYPVHEVIAKNVH